MAYIEKKGIKIGDWVYTTKRHESLSGVFTKGSYVKVIDIDPMRGYAIQDADGNQMVEIGWTI